MIGEQTWVVMKKNLSVTIDLEDYRKNRYSRDKPYQEQTEIILNWLLKKKIKATFFVVGTFAEDNPYLIQKISCDHNIAFHSFNHLSLEDETIERFKEETKRSKEYIEDLIGKAIVGFRAPYFSLTRKAIWVTDALYELGFKYSSSTIPADMPKFGFADIPEETFKWESGLIEFPMVLSNFLGRKIPSIGGVYLRYLPTKFIFKTLNHRGHRWTYFHPQDIYLKKSVHIDKDLNFLQNICYHFNRKKTLKKLDNLINDHKITTLEQQLSKIRINQLPIWKNS